MNKVIPTLLILAAVSSACANNTTSQQPASVSSKTPAAAILQGTDQKNAPKNEATEAISVCIRYIDRYCSEPDAKKDDIKPLAEALNNSISVISDVSSSKSDKIQSVREAMKVADQISSKLPFLKEDGMDNMLKKVITAIENMPEVDPDNIKPGKEEPTYEAKPEQPQAQPGRPQAQPGQTQAQSTQPQAQPGQTQAQSTQSQAQPGQTQQSPAKAK
ncbi:MAG: hypothetical protein ACI376_04910 [Candidatus Bruticola sp.]